MCTSYAIGIGSPQKHLDGKHTVFGQVVAGDEVIDQIKGGDQMIKVWIEG